MSRFDLHGSAYGQASVNRFRASWTLDGDVLTFGPGMTTMMAGPQPAMEQESRWMSLFQRQLVVRLDEPHLDLECDARTTRLVRVPQLTVTGAVRYHERIVMPADAVVQVDLRDTARADMQAPALAQQRIERPPNVPVPFRLLIDEDACAPPARLAISARIAVGDRLWWVTDSHYPVAPDQAEHELVLIRVPNP